METEDLASTRRDTVASMTATLKTAIDFPAVALDVAECTTHCWVYSELRTNAVFVNGSNPQLQPEDVQMVYVGGYKSRAGGNQNLNCTSWQAAVVSGSGGGPDPDCPGGGLPGGPSGGDWGHDGAWGTTAAGLKALLEWAEAPPKVAACRPFDWKPSGGGELAASIWVLFPILLPATYCSEGSSNAYTPSNGIDSSCFHAPASKPRGIRIPHVPSLLMFSAC